MENIINLFIYSGLSKESFYNVLPQTRVENRKNLVVFSFLAAGAFLLGFLSRFKQSEGMNIVGIGVVLAVFTVMAVLSATVAKKNVYVCDALSFTFTIMLLGTGVYSGVTQPAQRTTLLLAFYVFSSVLFCGRTIIYVLIILATEITYTVWILNTQTGSILSTNIVNSLIFSMVGAATTVYIMDVKYKRHEANYLNNYLLNRDALTNTLNRRSFELELENIKKNHISVAIGAFDINGLKFVNDNLGHAAGDELIKGAAECITKVFDMYGKVFRTGGDEFIVILDKRLDDLDELILNFKDIQSSWKGEQVESVNVSCGMAVLTDEFDSKLDETLKKADMLMYEEKRKYYEETGIERRKI